MINGLSPCEHRSRFVLIDLYQQREAVCDYTLDWTKEAFAQWLQLYGGIFEHPDGFGYHDITQPLKFEPTKYYIFVPHAINHPLFRWGFRFDEAGKFEVNPLAMWQRSQVR